MTDRAWSVVQALAQPLTDPASRTFLPALLLGAVVAVVWAWRKAPEGGLRAALMRGLAPGLWVRPTAVVDLQLLLARRLLALLWVVPAVGSSWVVAVWWVRTLDRLVGVPAVPEVPLWALSVAYSLVLFVAWDLSRYVLHRLMHEVPALWEIHQVHHSAEVLTPLTFHRIHPLESVLYGLRGLLVTGTVAGLAFWLWRGAAVEVTLLGVHALGLVLNAATGNLRHSHVWLGFGRWERWWISPAQHQLHHSADPRDYGCNYGTWLACWDRVGGSLRLSGATPPERFGVADGLNHRPDQLLSALVGPLRGLGWRLVRGPLRLARRSLALLGLAGAVQAAEPEEEGQAPHDDAAAAAPDREFADPYEIIVYGRDGVPRVAGSAHAIDEEELERFEYDDIGRVLGKVPGVYVRGEDGFGLRPNIGMRGGNSDRSAKITLLEDGVPLVPAPYAAPAAYYFPMPTRLVGVEVFKGPAATRHGPQTIGGAVNLLTRAVPEGTVGQVDVGVGMRSTAKLHAYAGTGNERAGILIEGAHLSSAGFKELDTGGPTGFERQDLMVKGKLAFDPGPVRHILEAKLGYGRERSHETYLGLTDEDFASTPWRRYAASARDLMAWQRTQADLSWRFQAETVEVRTVAYHRYLTRDWTKLNRFAGGPSLRDLLARPTGGQAAVYNAILRGEEDTASADQALMIGSNDRQFHSFGVQSVARHEVGGQRLSSSLEVGIRAHGDHVVRLHSEEPFAMVGGSLQRTEGERLTLLDSLSQAQALSAHVHEDLGIGRLHLLPGMRMEAIRTVASHMGEAPGEATTRIAPLPGMAVLAEIGERTDLFAGVHRGFSPVAPGQPATVQPELAWTWEAGVRAPLPEGQVELVGFFSDYANLSGACTLSGGCDERQIDRQYNAGAVHVYGVEALARRQVLLPAGLTLDGEVAYTLTRSAFLSDFRSDFPQFGDVSRGDALPYVPVHQGAARAVLAHDRASLAFAANARGPMRDVAGQGEFPEEAGIPAALLLDIAAEVVLTQRLRAYGTVNNVANAVVVESWRPFGARPAAPLQAMVGVKASL